MSWNMCHRTLQSFVATWDVRKSPSSGGSVANFLMGEEEFAMGESDIENSSGSEEGSKENEGADLPEFKEVRKHIEAKISSLNKNQRVNIKLDWLTKLLMQQGINALNGYDEYVDGFMKNLLNQTL
ncbi:hypothetical protein LX36DRAFT_673739 [Colletotrichum falcatum]|nr:hypothetical protein LX36DRAFT_673739 [Colletotrichum falcatum]